MYSKKLYSFLNKNGRNVTGTGNFTHTSLPDRNNCIPGGSYLIIGDDIEKFNKIYFKEIIEHGGISYLTEKQIENGNILIDLDLKFIDDGSDERIITRNNNKLIEDILEEYVSSIENMFNLDNITKFNAFIFYKDKDKRYSINNNNQDDNNGTKCIKDGLHIIINLRLNHDKQMMLREEVMKSFHDMGTFDEYDIVNTLDDIFDKSISKGSTNWQVYGSRKPGSEPYKLKYVYDICKNSSSNEYEIKKSRVKLGSKKNQKTIFRLISARSESGYIVELNEEYTKKYMKIMKNKNVKRYNPKNNKGVLVSLKNSGVNVDDDDEISLDISKITNEEELDKAIENLFDKIDKNHNKFKDIHNLTMALTSNYYDPFIMWFQVGCALYNSSNPPGLYFYTWVKFSTKSDKFSWPSSIHDCLNKWIEMSEWDNKNDDNRARLTFKTIYHWCKKDNPIEYNKILSSSTDHLIEQCVKSKDRTCQGLDADIAALLYSLYKNDVICTKMSNKGTWLHFKGHRWVNSPDGLVITKRISKDVSDLFSKKITNETSIQNELLCGFDLETDNEDEDKNTRYLHVANELKKHPKKRNVLSECKELFYDEDQKMQKLMDEDPYLVCFNNGVFDIRNGEFRNGYPEDYITLSTNLDYIEIDETNKKHTDIMEEINAFMLSLFPDPSLNKYMWQHAASCCIGENRNQTFQIYNGCGSNGKSKFVELMSLALGDYADKLDIGFLTQDRGKAGGPQPHFINLKGKRFVAMEEPRKGNKLNDGLIKQLTGGDVMNMRNMHEKEILSIKPRYDLVCSCNHLLEVDSLDYGTWRRIRCVDFESKFVDKPSNDPRDKEFLIDRDLDTKMKAWPEIFISMVLRIAVKTKGIVDDCQKVIAAGLKYKNKMDFFSRFIKQKIIITGDEQNTLEDNILVECFRKWYKLECPDQRAHTKQDIMEYFTTVKDFRNLKHTNNRWYGIKYSYRDNAGIMCDIDSDSDSDSDDAKDNKPIFSK